MGSKVFASSKCSQKNKQTEKMNTSLRTTKS